jgi:hypothetical protein
MKLVTSHDKKLNFLKTGQADHGLVMARLVEKATIPGKNV